MLRRILEAMEPGESVTVPYQINYVYAIASQIGVKVTTEVVYIVKPDVKSPTIDRQTKVTRIDKL